MYITDHIKYFFQKVLVFLISFIFLRILHISITLLRRTDIQIFRFKSKQRTNQIKITDILLRPTLLMLIYRAFIVSYIHCVNNKYIK